MSKQYFAAIAQQDAALNIKMRIGKNWPNYAKKVYRESYLNVSLRNVKKIKVDTPKTRGEHKETVLSYSVKCLGYKTLKAGLRFIKADDRMKDNRFLLKHLRDSDFLTDDLKGKLKVLRHEACTEVYLKSCNQLILTLDLPNELTHEENSKRFLSANQK